MADLDELAFTNVGADVLQDLDGSLATSHLGLDGHD
jgi:hypothetical protein